MMNILLSDGFEIEWHTESKPPEIWQVEKPRTLAEKMAKHRTVVEVYADGGELDHVLRVFTNLPIRSGGSRGMTWFGSDAQFIVANL